MITRQEFADIDKEIKEAIQTTLDNLKTNNASNYFVFLADGEYVQKYENTIQRHSAPTRYTYKTSSTSDFATLEDTITRKIKAFQQKSKTVKSLNSTPVVETEGLKSHEIALLILAMENQISKEDSTSVYSLKNEMEKAGYTDIATSVGIRTLTKLGMIETFKYTDEWNNNQEYIACRLTDIGENWILSNQEQLQFRRTGKKAVEQTDDLPF